MLRDLPAEQLCGSIQAYEVDLVTGLRGQLAREIKLGVKRQRLVMREDRDVEIAVGACTLLGERAEQHREAQRWTDLEYTFGFVDQLVHIVEYTGRFRSGPAEGPANEQARRRGPASMGSAWPGG